ncbi:polysaccharide biosynthesis/export family protein [Alishewanella sp. d11]|uniref:polysaccharide biosynthesis/export family protein n=1 Tax=Alishewanella sp. d11 TaxID=3414030 RepID=UPI003BF8CAB4
MMWRVLLVCCLLSPLFSFADDSYLLGAGDKIAIRVFGHTDLDLETQLTDSGTINYPFLGSIKVTGLTLKQLETLIYNGLKGDYLVEPNINVGIAEYRPFYIHGEVRKPGAFPYQPGLTVNQAIALAGGLTERASRDRITLSREANKEVAETATLASRVNAGDTIIISQRFF